MIIKPKVRGFVCVTTHPVGCAKHVEEQIQYTKSKGEIAGAPKKALIIGSSTGYGLSSRIALAFGGKTDTLGVFFEREPANGRAGSPGWYNSEAFSEQARKEGLYADSINGDAFSDEIREQTIAKIKEDMGKVDLVIYSLASPRRSDPRSGETYKSVLKPIGEVFTGKTVNTDKKLVHEVSIEPASEEDVTNTVKVMGGEDWEWWMSALKEADVLSDGVTTLAYSYIGPEVTWPIYKNGTIGTAKLDLDRAATTIRSDLSELNGRAYVSVNKAVVTQASSAIPVVPLYVSALLKIMKEEGIDEGCIEQMNRLFRDKVYGAGELGLDVNERVRVDDWEMREDIQQKISDLWPQITTENLSELTDFDRYQNEFLKLFGFGVNGVDYDAEVDL